MSKSKEPIALPDYVGDKDEPNPHAVTLCRLMTEQNIPAIFVGYSGSGDSGNYDRAKVAEYSKESKTWEASEVETSDEINAATWALIDVFVGPDFNNDGSEGEVIFKIMKNGKLKMEGEHRTFHTESDATPINNELVDPADFI